MTSEFDSEGLTIVYDTEPFNIRCPWCGAEPGEKCWDSVDEVVKQNFHGDRHHAAGRRYQVQ